MVGGAGLDARQFTNLSTLERDRLITPTAEMFVRTAAPRALPPASSWSIQTRGFAAAEGVLSIDALQRDAQSMGAHLIECSGNADPDNFGLMSVTDWDGVPLTTLLAQLGVRSGGAGVLVRGVDPEEQTRSSIPGASWVFSLADLERRRAFLAVRMNGQLLTADHGAPVRLVVPGWYGCCWIKWVNELRLVGADEAATSQMVEFSLRTHQSRVPERALDYAPPEIDLAAMPIRVEKRRHDGKLDYRIVGIMWGGDKPVDRLAIRFRAGDEPIPFTLCPSEPRSHLVWSLWEYRWRPTQPGVYSIALKAVDSTIRTRRLDVSYYVRRVVIDEV
jgi:DMSO/TMAO reductase YedYZ molybdopterin-dependent catalytic subunit